MTDNEDLTDIQKDVLKWAKKRARGPIVTHRRFLPEAEYVAGFEERNESVPPFIVFQPFEVHDEVRGYLVPCRPEHPDAEKVEIE